MCKQCSQGYKAFNRFCRNVCLSKGALDLRNILYPSFRGKNLTAHYTFWKLHTLKKKKKKNINKWVLASNSEILQTLMIPLSFISHYVTGLVYLFNMFRCSNSLQFFHSTKNYIQRCRSWHLQLFHPGRTCGHSFIHNLSLSAVVAFKQEEEIRLRWRWTTPRKLLTVSSV